MLQIVAFWAPGKANLPGALGRHCRDLVPTFCAGCFLKLTVPAFSSSSEMRGTLWVPEALVLCPLCGFENSETSVNRKIELALRFRERKEHPKKSNTEIFFLAPLSPFKFYLFAFFLHFKEKNSPNTRNFRGRRPLKKVDSGMAFLVKSLCLGVSFRP